MAYTLPQFNLEVGIWRGGSTPVSSPTPTIPNQPAQLYELSRPTSITEPFMDDFVATWPILCVWRFPVELVVAFPDSWTQVPVIIAYTDVTGTLRCYRVQAWDIVHPGFPNAYAMMLCCQCDPTGLYPDTGR